MNNLFQSHKELTEDDYNNLWENGLFIFDANVLLDLYRLPENARTDLLTILKDEKIVDRLWLPFQVSLEYTHNRLEAISDQKNKFTSVHQIVNETISQIGSTYSELQRKLSELQLKKRHSVINPDKYINDDIFKQSIQQLNEFNKYLKELNEKQPDVNDKDNIKKEVLQIFDGKIGAPFTKEELKTIYSEGEERLKDNIPPGYKDNKKEGFYLYEDKTFIKKYGDYIVWKEILNKSSIDKLEYIILVTGDTKEDWWQEKRGKKIGPRYELLNEIYFKSKSVKVFHMYDTSTFMQYAKKYLKIDIKEQSINETKDLLEFSREKTTNEKPIIQKVPIVKELQNLLFSLFSFIPTTMDFNCPIKYLQIPLQTFQEITFEILTNVVKHALAQTVDIRLFEIDGYTVLRFRNKRKLGDDKKLIKSGNGLKYITELMTPYGYAHYRYTKDGFFLIKLYFEKRICS